MRIAVDVRRVVQEIDLDTGETTNFLVFMIGNIEHVVPATAEQLQEAIYEARLHQDGGEQINSKYQPEAPVLGAVGEIPDFVDELLSEPVDEGELTQAILNRDSPSLFDDVSSVLTEEDLAAYQTEGRATMPLRVNVVSDETTDGAMFEEIMQHHPAQRSDAPLTSRQQRKANIEANRPHAQPKGERAVIAALRARAKQVPPRGLQPHQVDEAGNPKVPQVSPGFARYTNSDQPDIQISAPSFPGLVGMDEDGFEQG